MLCTPRPLPSCDFTLLLGGGARGVRAQVCLKPEGWRSRGSGESRRNVIKTVCTHASAFISIFAPKSTKRDLLVALVRSTLTLGFMVSSEKVSLTAGGPAGLEGPVNLLLRSSQLRLQLDKFFYAIVQNDAVPGRSWRGFCEIVFFECYET